MGLDAAPHRLAATTIGPHGLLEAHTVSVASGGGSRKPHSLPSKPPIQHIVTSGESPTTRIREAGALS